MLFNSAIFFIYFAVVYSLYWFLHKNLRAQNFLLLVASYIFYGWWDPRFLLLIVASTIIDYFTGRKLGSLPLEAEKTRRRWLALSVIFNLGMLGIFKYFNFFAESFVEFASVFGWDPGAVTLNIILPVGISFYTFQTMSYTIDIYRGTLKPTHSFLNFATFVAFFPQLVAGPIERASRLLSQIETPRTVNPAMIHTGFFLILWGYFKKVAVADNIGTIANFVFDNYETLSGLELVSGVLAFAIQIYCDFSGYSDIARGLARLMGFELMVNFRLPYFAMNPSDFWNRWHISLSTWLRDYLYIPLGGNKNGQWNTYRNLMITMLLGGLWHGAAWNFVLWGFYHGVILVLYRRFERHPVHANPWSGEHNRLVVMAKLILMFCLTLYGWLLFRASSLDQIVSMTQNIFKPVFTTGGLVLLAITITYSMILIGVEIIQYRSRDLLIITKWYAPLQLLIYIILLLWIVFYGATTQMEFIYFQF